MNAWMAGLLALAVCAGGMVFLIPRAGQWGLLDHPRGRKDHAQATPVVGGIAMWLGLLAGLAWLAPGTSEWSLLAAAAMLVAIGVFDDRHELHWALRMLAHVMAALCVVHVGDVELQRLGYGDAPLTLSLGGFGAVVTVIAIVGLINALNMIDGLDGLSASVALTSILAMAVLAWVGGAGGLLPLFAVVAGSLLAYLAFNLRLPWRPRALAFMGDSGSAMLGLLLAWAAIRLTHLEGSEITPAMGPWLVALPILDCLALIVLRVSSGRSPFHADRSHLHYLLRDRGWPVSLIVAVAVFAQGAIALLGWTLHLLGVPDLGLIGLFLLLLALHVGLLLFLRPRTAAPEEALAAALAGEGPPGR